MGDLEVVKGIVERALDTHKELKFARGDARSILERIFSGYKRISSEKDLKRFYENVF